MLSKFKSGRGAFLGSTINLRPCQKDKIGYNSDIYHHYYGSLSIQKFGFTLAEVLITLGIIGVVAAMTMPVLIGSATAVRYKSQFKKTLSVLNQAVKMNYAKENYDFSGAETKDDIDKIFNDNIKTIKTMYGANNQELKDYYETMPDNGNASMSNHGYIYIDYLSVGTHLIMPDGSLFVYDYANACTLPEGRTARDEILSPTLPALPDDGVGTQACVGFIDVNGFNPPNKEVTCADGTVSDDINEKCTLSKTKINDIFPVFYYDQTIIPATNAANAVLSGN